MYIFTLSFFQVDVMFQYIGCLSNCDTIVNRVILRERNTTNMFKFLFLENEASNENFFYIFDLLSHADYFPADCLLILNR